MDPVMEDQECEKGKMDANEKAKIIGIVFSDQIIDIDKK